MKPRYIVTMSDEIDGNTRYAWVGLEGEPDFKRASVWCDTERFTADCAACSTALRGMSRSCVHARAVKRLWTLGKLKGLPAWPVEEPAIILPIQVSRVRSLNERVTDLEKQVAALTLLAKSNL